MRSSRQFRCQGQETFTKIMRASLWGKTYFIIIILEQVCVCVYIYIYIFFFIYKMLFQPKAFLMIHRREFFFKCRPLLVFVERERKRRNTVFHSNTKGTSKLLYRSIVALQSKQHKCCKLILYYMHVITWHTKMQHWVLYSMYQRISAVFIQ